MLQRLYVHNYRCLENFELNLKDMSSALLIGKNGAGKSTIVKVFEIFQKIGRGVTRVDQLISFDDFTNSRFDVPIRFEIEVLLEDFIYKYFLALEVLDNTKKISIFEEKLLIADQLKYSVIGGKGEVYSVDQKPSAILVNGQYVSLAHSFIGVEIFKSWLAQMIILAPIPSLITGESTGETLELKRDGSNFGQWVSGVLSRYPAAYSQIDKYLREVMPDIQDFLNEQIGRNAKSMIVRFEANNTTLSVDFEDLSDGEKCFFLCAVVLAANKYYGPLFCFWDEPDNYLSLSEVGHFITSLRRAFKNSGQILVTSHNEEAIRKFSDENTFILDRKSHLEPTLIRRLSDLSFTGDLINSLISGDIEL